MSNTGGLWTPGSPDGPIIDVTGRRASAMPPPTNNDPGPQASSGAADKTDQLLNSMLGAIQNQNALFREMDRNIALMAGKTDQTHTMSGGATHTAGQATVPIIPARFKDPGGELREYPHPLNVRGSRGALPAYGSVTGIRARAQRAVSQAQQFTPQLQSVVDPKTNRITTMKTSVDPATGESFLEPATAEEEKTLRGQELRGAAVQHIISSAVGGGGLRGMAQGLGHLATSMLPEEAIPVVGGAMVAGSVALETAHMIADQRAKNAQFQSVMGGSNFQGFGQRISQTAFGLRNIAGLGQGQAEEAFMGATRLGMRGTERNQALGMAVSAFSSMGMSVEQSLQAMSVQAQSGYENFNQLESSLKAVSDAAKETSQNANTVRDAFINTLQGLTQSIGGGVGTNAAAQAISTTNTGLGRVFSGTNVFSSLAQSPNFLYMAASNAGIGYDQALSKSLSDPNFVSQSVNKIMNQFMGAAGGNNVKPVIANILKQGNFVPGKNGVLSPGQVQSITPQVLNQFSGQIPAIQSMLQTLTGQTFTPQETAQFLIQYGQGNTNLPNAASTAPQKVGAAQAGALGRTLNTPDQNIIDIGAAAKGTGLAGGTKIDVGTIGGSGGKNADVRLNYLRQVAKTRTNSPIVDAALKDNSNFNKLFYVNTPQGTQTVSFSDLVSKYPDQLASGEATYATGSNAGGTMVGTAVSGNYGGATAAPSGSRASTTPVAGKLTSQAAAWQKKYAGKPTADEKAGKDKTNISISATPQLAQLFSFAINGQSATVSSATNLTPAASQVNSENLPGTTQTYSGGLMPSSYARQSFLGRTLPGTMNASINGIPMRLNPLSVTLDYQVKTSETPTLGGMVVQVFGTEMSDLIVTGTFGKGGYKEQLEFLNRMLAIAGYQANQSFNTAGGPVRFLYPNRGFDFQVFLKDYDSASGLAIDYENTNIAPDWRLTLFVDNDNLGGGLARVAADAYIQRLSNGIGYDAVNKYNGNINSAQVAAFLATQNFAGNPMGYLDTAFGDPVQQTTTQTTPSTGTPASAPGSPATGGTGAGRYSGANWLPVVNHGGAMTGHVGLVLHVCQGDNSQFGHFNTPGSNAVSAHFWVSKTGVVEQYVDGGTEAWHAEAANGTYNGVETEGFNSDPLTDAQVNAVAAIYKWGVASYGWPKRLSASPGDAGFAWHGEGGSDWGGHIYCPGDIRKAQMPDILKLV